MKIRRRLVAVAAGALAVTTAAAGFAVAQTSTPTVDIPRRLTGTPGNMVFFHPDGTGLNHWNIARTYWRGPDGSLNWDKLPEIAPYRGHMTDVLTGTSNGGATVHAFGYKVEGLGSFGKDGNGTRPVPNDRFIDALSGYPGSILREAGNEPNGYPTGLVNDGNVGEPGTGVFAAEVGNRNEWNDIALQIIAGRDGAAPVSLDGPDAPPVVILGGGERNFLPSGTARCTPEQADDLVQSGGIVTYPLDCMVHTLDWGKPGLNAVADRTDGRNLIQEAYDAGYTVVRTRAEFRAVASRVARDPSYAPRVLGLFAAHHTFNDVPEERLVAEGFVDPSIDVNAKESNLILWGAKDPSSPSFNPPRHNEMQRLAHRLLVRFGNAWDKPYFLVSEPESNDNFGNNDNAIGMLNAMQRADASIGVTREFIANRAREGVDVSEFGTSILVAADSDAGGMMMNSLFPLTDAATGAPVLTPDGQYTYPPTVGTANDNPTGVSAQNVNAPVDGRYGRASAPFVAEPDQFGKRMAFGVTWGATPDFFGAILARGAGGNAAAAIDLFSERFDNTDVYRILYLGLFGEKLPAKVGELAPPRD